MWQKKPNLPILAIMNLLLTLTSGETEHVTAVPEDGCWTAHATGTVAHATYNGMLLPARLEPHLLYGLHIDGARVRVPILREQPHDGGTVVREELVE
jgi:hypothetical protein